MIVTKFVTIVQAFCQGGGVIVRSYDSKIPLTKVRNEIVAYCKDEYRSAYGIAMEKEPRLVITEGIPFLEA